MTEKLKRNNLGMIMAVYLAGIFMGALDTGIVTPARTIIQNHLMVTEKAGIWMITIYTLAFAASIPVMGKLADKYGRKYIYLFSIFLFGIGSLFCGLSQSLNSFSVLLIARAIQAVGGGGIMPVATAEFGTTFPVAKRGMALGLVGGVYGIANIFGASAGSAIMDLFGTGNWQFIFYVNIPITIFIIAAGMIFLSNNKSSGSVRKTDIWGILILTIMILSFMYGLKNLDFFNITGTFTNIKVYPFLLAFIILLPLFVFAEKSAEDPVMNLSFFTNRGILITLILSFAVGMNMMGMIFVPQFSENALRRASGSGGYFVIILGLFAGAGAPLSGKLIDKYGPKLILALGFIITVAGSLFLVIITTASPGNFTIFISLMLVGLGMGFTIGTPLNYMMLENTKNEESNSALATLSLVRSIGTVIAPAIMIGFISHAGANISGNIMAILPEKIAFPSLPYSEEITEKFDKMKNNPMMKNIYKNAEIPDFSKMTVAEISMKNMNSGYRMPAGMIDLMKSSDVTNITDNIKIISGSMFSEMSGKIINNIQSGIQKGIDRISGKGMPKGMPSVNSGSNGTKPGAKPDMNSMISSMKKNNDDLIFKMTAMKTAVPDAFQTAETNYLKEIDGKKEIIEKAFQDTLNGGFKQVYLTVTISSVAALIILLFYRKKTAM
jgi:EmrB/QacA subfamily drug resistance transporter